LLTFSRRLESKLRPVNLNHELDNVVKMLKRTMPKSIEMVFNPEEDIDTVKADPAQIQQVIMNLAVNARDAMPRGGTLTIETENTSLDADYCKTHLEAQEGNYVMVTVSDTGVGMDRNTAKHIFDPFFTTKDPGQGTGLGLAIVYGVIKNHGGNILCYSEPGMGTTFRIYLPVAAGESAVSEEEDPSQLPGGSETILLVDDEEAILSNGEALLSNYGYNAIIANNGKQALEIYRERWEEISLVLLDLIMPRMDGKTLMEEILKINPKARVIIASGYAANGIMEEALEAGAMASLRKPFESAKMLKLVRAALDEEDLSGY
jgi:CheY-like chemotaxis protein/two-component sensor histidine kinase